MKKSINNFRNSLLFSNLKTSLSGADAERTQSSLRRIIPVLLLLGMLFFSPLSKAASPEEVYQSCIKKVSGAKSMKVGFTLSSAGHSASGTLLIKGSKFAVSFPGLGTWYDGKSMWSYGAANKETTVWKPSKTELAESNPMLYLSMASDFNVKADSKSSKAVSILTLTPKRRNAGIKSVVLTINNSTSLPKKLVISAGGQTSTITINSVTLNPALADSQFTYPKNKYPGVTISDLR